MKRLVAIALCVLGVGVLVQANAQNATSVSPTSTGDNGFATDTIYSAHPIREDHKLFKMGVWRRIDLREKYNRSFYGSGEIKDDGIMMNIYQAIVDENAFEVFADEDFTEPLSIADFSSNFWLNDLGDSVFVKELYYLDFREDFVFDKLHGQRKFDVKYIELIMPSQTNADAGQKTIGFIRFKDFYEHFKEHPEAKWFNFKNPAKNLGYDEAFDLRLFRSVVRKYTNEEDALIIDRVNVEHPNPELAAFLEAMEFEYELLEQESSLWEW